ncbi:hypothetical protein ASPNIDRAFT_37201 [Aspergillus niger ATCC 1015]|uniref:Uncharacterized protein n=1 Tax=Aspergillus niger (strain ATCC 1015 / CBS 113.46 / FGSC A1144 / LSHB Ac4 / NCTC 3858a / NRRL 328 / USDA 3528.7) TaxID=380704 RepID=G3Y0Q5_ASPNA|nr:uncharacterized protein BO96DRAFT_351792 [Aspergillus niger CBS 101883]EHA23179.1 hypothetical protein ASPNIDRAFT_37201 [Aspergillus niger ATCC 1015]PYH50777.1 hypothetical protein BO96DRAFT_351792 [Aspergillus niger CBS 101883]
MATISIQYRIGIIDTLSIPPGCRCLQSKFVSMETFQTSFGSSKGSPSANVVNYLTIDFCSILPVRSHHHGLASLLHHYLMLDAAGVCPSLTAILNAYSIYCCLIAICEWMDDLETISRYGVGRGKCSSLSWRVLLSWRALVVGVNLQVSTIGGPSSRWLLPLFPFALTRDRLFWLLPLWSTPPLPQRLSLDALRKQPAKPSTVLPAFSGHLLIAPPQRSLAGGECGDLMAEGPDAIAMVQWRLEQMVRRSRP